jgi:hypothetical protein
MALAKKEPRVMTRRIVEKDPCALMALGLRLKTAKETLPAAEYDAFRRAEPELYHEARPEDLVEDKDERLIKLASMQVCWDYIDRLPSTGWATLRELSKLSEPVLRELFRRGAITSRTTRENIDCFRSVQKIRAGGQGVADRHPVKKRELA